MTEREEKVWKTGEFTLTKADARGFSLHVFVLGRPFSFALCGVLSAVAIILGLNGLSVGSALGTGLMGYGLALLAAAFLFPVLIGLIFARVLSSQPRHYELRGSDGIVAYFGDNFSEIRWPAILKIGRLRGAIYLYVTQSVAHIIPARAFDNRAEADAFARAVKEEWHRRRSEPQPMPIVAAAASPFSITYALDKSDYLHGNKRLPQLTSTKKSIYWRSIAVIGLVVVVIMAFLAATFGVGYTDIYLLPGIIFLYLVLIPVMRKRNVMRQLQQIKGSFEPQTMSLDTDGITSVSQYSRGNFKWSDITRIESDGRLLYWVLQNRVPFFIPRRAFLDNAQADEFLAAARAYKAGESPITPVSSGVWPPPPSQ